MKKISKSFLVLILLISLANGLLLYTASATNDEDIDSIVDEDYEKQLENVIDEDIDIPTSIDNNEDSGNTELQSKISNYTNTNILDSLDYISVDSLTRLEEEISNATQKTTILLTNDIQLTNGTLIIPADKEIVLQGNYKIIGQDGFRTITVLGSLTLAGPTITHELDAEGGGVYVSNGAFFLMKDGEISGNIATDLRGGGIYSSAATITISGGKIANNFAGQDGGGIYANDIIITGGEISENKAFWGGGIFAFGEIEFRNATISLNQAATGAGIFSGGGKTTIYSGEICYNKADAGDYPNQSGNGGGIRGYDIDIRGGKIFKNEADFGAGIMSYSNNTVTMSGGEISENIANKSGGGIHGGEYGSIIIVSGEITNNIAEHGGAIYAKDGGDIIISNGNISGNTAKFGGGIYAGTGTITINDGNILNNQGDNGGGIYSFKGNIKLYGGKISNNIADYGGGVFSNQGTMEMTGSEIFNNTADLWGGGIYNNSDFDMNGGQIYNNNAIYGGGILNYRKIDITGGAIHDNYALEGDGGGIFTLDYSKLTIADGVEFFGNVAAIGYTNRKAEDDSIYNQNIKSSLWSEPFNQGYNNFDINYMGVDIKMYAVLFYKNDGTTDIFKVVVVPEGEIVGENMPENPTRTDYSFIDWNMAANGKGLSFSPDSPILTLTKVFAQWIEDEPNITPPPTLEPDGPSTPSVIERPSVAVKTSDTINSYVYISMILLSSILLLSFIKMQKLNRKSIHSK